MFHSELVGITKNGPVAISVAFFGKTKKTNKDYVKIAINGKEEFYTPENANCFEFLKARKGQSFMVSAVGNRDSASFVEAGSPQPSAQQSNQAPQDHSQPPHQSPTHVRTAAEVIHDANSLLAKCEKSYILALDAADRVRAKYESSGKKMADQQFQVMTSSFNITLADAGITREMPL